jgi:hypothetical protein
VPNKCARIGRLPLSLIGACQIPVHVRKFAVPLPQIPCSRYDGLIAKGLQNAAYRFQTAINSAYESAKFAVNSLLAGNFDPETGSLQTASTARHIRNLRQAAAFEQDFRICGAFGAEPGL